jgi:hypothetical protein
MILESIVSRYRPETPGKTTCSFNADLSASKKGDDNATGNPRRTCFGFDLSNGTSRHDRTSSPANDPSDDGGASNGLGEMAEQQRLRRT